MTNSGMLAVSAASSFRRLGHALREFAHVLFSRVERTHPAHDSLFLNPRIEEILLLNLLDGVLRNLREDTVGFDLPHDAHLWNLSDLRLEHLCHPVGMLGAALPQILGQQGLKLHRDESHLGSQLHALLAQVKKIGTQSTIKENDGFSAHDTVLRSTERKHIHSQIARNFTQRLPQA